MAVRTGEFFDYEQMDCLELSTEYRSSSRKRKRCDGDCTVCILALKQLEESK